MKTCREGWNEGAAVALAQEDEHAGRVTERRPQPAHVLHVAAANARVTRFEHAKTAPSAPLKANNTIPGSYLKLSPEAKLTADAPEHHPRR